MSDFLPIRITVYRDEVKLLADFPLWQQCFARGYHGAVIDQAAAGVIAQMTKTWEEACAAAEYLQRVRDRRKIAPVKNKPEPSPY